MSRYIHRRYEYYSEVHNTTLRSHKFKRESASNERCTNTACKTSSIRSSRGDEPTGTDMPSSLASYVEGYTKKEKKKDLEFWFSTKFSTVPDESPDISSEKQLGICIMYMDEVEFTPVTRFFDMILVEDGGAMGLHKILSCGQTRWFSMKNGKDSSYTIE
eukprot:gene11074-19935_t